MNRYLTPGMRHMLLGTFVFSIGSLLIKVAGERIPTMEILFVRGCIGILFCHIVLRRTGVGMLGNRRMLLAVRGLVGFLSLFAEFYAIVHLPLADAIVIIFSHPAVVALMAWMLLGERLGVKGITAVGASLAGVALVCRPGFLFGEATTVLDPVAVSVALAGVVACSIAILSVRTLAKTEHPAVVMFYPPLIITLAGPFFSSGWVMPTPSEWACLIAVGLLMNLGQYYMTKGYAVESAARVSAVSCLEIVFASFWGLSFLGEIPDIWSIGGGLLIVGGVLLLGREASEEAEQSTS